MLRTWRFVTLLLAALGLTMGAAHALEMAPRMAWDAELYARVTSTLYVGFGTAGAAVQVGAVLAAIALCVLARRCAGFRFTLAGTLALVLSLALWAALVAPVNTAWGDALRTAPDTAPAAYLRLRPRWEYGHLAAFAAWLAGFALLLLAVVVETPRSGPGRDASSRAREAR